MGPDFNTALMLKFLHTLLISYVGEVDSGWSLLSSTYCFHNLGLEGADSRASSSKHSMYRFAIYHCRDRGAHGSTLPLFIKFTTIVKIGGSQAHVQ